MANGYMIIDYGNQPTEKQWDEYIDTYADYVDWEREVEPILEIDPNMMKEAETIVNGGKLNQLLEKRKMERMNEKN